MTQSRIGILSIYTRRALSAAALALAVFAGTASARAEDTIKIAFTEPMSGPFGQVGQQNLQQMQYLLDYINRKGGALGRKFELVVFDNKSQPSEELIALKSMADQNIPLVLQFSGSNIAAALIDGIEKHNARNPTNRILYLNGGALATDLTNEKCSFWHFRFDAPGDQRAMMLVRALSPDTKKVYLLNQDYLWGQSLKRDLERFLARFRPDIAIVGNELMPLGKVQDFSPYVSKIKASGAQALITDNWGPDLILLIKAGNDAGLDVKYYSQAAHLGGVPTAIGPGGEGRLFTSMGYNPNVVADKGDPALKEWADRFYKTHSFEFYWGGERAMFEYLQAAIEKAGSVDPEKIAEAMEGMTRPDMLGHQTLMRADDHQLFLPYYVAVFTKDVKYDSERTGLGWEVMQTYEAKDLVLPTTCNMKRPAM